MKNQKGITLIALVITIIVLLILAGVSISMVLGENGVLSQANKSKTETEISSEKEMVGLAYSGLNSEVLIGNKEKVTASELEEEINRLYGEEKVTVTEENKILIVKFILSQREYEINSNGSIKEHINIEEVLANASKHPDQTLTEDVGVAEDGTIVNLDLWNYKLGSDNKYYLGEPGSSSYSGYNNEDIVDGKIQGKIPMYIKEDNDGNFYTVENIMFYNCTNLVIAPEIPSSVTNMHWTFMGCTSLIESPEISNSVTEMSGTFFDCTSLVKVPEIPNSVTKMVNTFWNCTSLVEAPEIPNSVIDMSGTFYGCTSLVKVLEIPSSVTNMKNTFYNCTNLTGTIRINASPTSYSYCLKNAATAEGCNLVLVGNGENDEAITNIYNTKSDTSNITIGSGT